MKYRNKALMVEAFQLGKNCMPGWFNEKISNGEVTLVINSVGDVSRCGIKTRNGVMTAEAGDFVIKGAEGELYPCKTDIFYETYELAED